MFFLLFIVSSIHWVPDPCIDWTRELKGMEGTLALNNVSGKQKVAQMFVDNDFFYTENPK